VVSEPASEQESELEWKYVGTAHVVVVEGASMVKAVAVVLRMVVVVLVVLVEAVAAGMVAVVLP